MIQTLKVAAVFAVIALVLIGSAFVLDLIADDAVKDTLKKTMAVIAIFTVGSLAVVLIAGRGKSGGKKG